MNKVALLNQRSIWVTPTPGLVAYLAIIQLTLHRIPDGDRRDGGDGDDSGENHHHHDDDDDLRSGDDDDLRSGDDDRRREASSTLKLSWVDLNAGLNTSLNKSLNAVVQN